MCSALGSSSFDASKTFWRGTHLRRDAWVCVLEGRICLRWQVSGPSGQSRAASDGGQVCVSSVELAFVRGNRSKYREAVREELSNAFLFISREHCAEA